MEINVHKSDSRGLANHGWLYSRHTYSFSSYKNPDRMGFGQLLVINDDIVEHSMGFGTHHHDNMEIISIPLNGSLRHEDSMGNQHIIEAGDVQIMSAGTGVTHSEYNNSDTSKVNFLQIWVLPKTTDTQPRYEQQRFNSEDRKNKLQLLISPNGENGSMSINQDAYFSLINLEEGHSIDYQFYNENNGVYLFVISGSLMVGDTLLGERDGAEVSDTPSLELTADKEAQLLCIETPMK